MPTSALRCLTRGKPAAAAFCVPSLPQGSPHHHVSVVRGASSRASFKHAKFGNSSTSLPLFTAGRRFENSNSKVLGSTVNATRRSFWPFSRKKKMAPVTVQEVEAARDAWIAAVRKGSVDETVGCYDPVEGKLLGTVDLGDVRTGKDKIREYFVGFLETNYDTVVPNFPATIAEGDIQQLGDGTVAYSGYYTFDLGKGSTNKVANAKFTYIYKRGDDGSLKILLHNSGFTPAGAVEK
ncbi:hypothetical protein HOP50_17g79280 [Chloropicon primus]|uniref:Calcium/calmodulin-dependent protein kinase II association-domain domain-containing protein n=2 Tax=Chloropicon primus TaxID=1764295 RepID=A0A5B8MX44_9CHLO|nr:hypothetical protein A3770_17p79060 [Chloropicon primus]UPR04586.1 hypothetical protein HOP50_17g79280 [Chloropicon primus]|mmetsp:Transcript_27352/g.57949  ORF Transcript_27352/g.57949 Transcript_27352/m.57949 type:complete len:237 (+) Transcript_27352:52-762(+)|eukprot:QDZ25388.1 hypothetical protein A3770_17p79060 [Chloropicon primus]